MMQSVSKETRVSFSIAINIKASRYPCDTVLLNRVLMNFNVEKLRSLVSQTELTETCIQVRLDGRSQWAGYTFVGHNNNRWDIFCKIGRFCSMMVSRMTLCIVLPHCCQHLIWLCHHITRLASFLSSLVSGLAAQIPSLRHSHTFNSPLHKCVCCCLYPLKKQFRLSCVLATKRWAVSKSVLLVCKYLESAVVCWKMRKNVWAVRVVWYFSRASA